MGRLLPRSWRVPVSGFLRSNTRCLLNTQYLAGVIAVVVNGLGEMLLLRCTHKDDCPRVFPAGWPQIDLVCLCAPNAGASRQSPEVSAHGWYALQSRPRRLPSSVPRSPSASASEGGP